MSILGEALSSYSPPLARKADQLPVRALRCARSPQLSRADLSTLREDITPSFDGHTAAHSNERPLRHWLGFASIPSTPVL